MCGVLLILNELFMSKYCSLASSIYLWINLSVSKIEQNDNDDVNFNSIAIMADWINFENTDAVDNLSTHEVCNSLEEFNLKFKRHIENANNSLLPQLLSIQLDIGFGGTFNIPVDLLSTSLAFPVVQLDTTDPKNIILPPEKRRRLEASATETAYQSMNVLEILLAQPENKPIPIEREVAKEIMASVTEIDGYGMLF